MVCEKSSVADGASFYIHIIIIVFICTNVKSFYFLVLPLNILNSPRLEELKIQRRKVLHIKILIGIFLFLIFLTGLIFISRWKKININNIVVSGNEVVDTEDIENVVQSDITGHYFWIFPKT